MAGPARATERGFERLVNFCDAVVAIAITLLILPLVDSVSKSETLSHLLNQHSDRFVAFLLTFAVIARFWVLHQGLFERINSYNSALIWANLAWLASIVFLPFPTELLSVRGTGEASVRFAYIATVLANSAFLFVIELVMRRSPALWPDGVVDLALADGAIAVLLMVVALIVGTAVPAIGMWAMLVLLATGPLQALVERRRHATPA